jgi:hypothetical protein
VHRSAEATCGRRVRFYRVLASMAGRYTGG